MVDFRYHLVSLIAVFLALATGIILGSGPLRDAFTGQMTGQYAQVQQERNDLRADVSELEAATQKHEAFIIDNMATLTGNNLDELSLAVILAPDLDENISQQVIDSLTERQIQVTEVVLSQKWSLPSERSFRQGIAGLLTEHLEPKPAADTALENQLSYALVQALTQNQQNSQTILKILHDSELLVELPEQTPVNAVLVLADENVEIEAETQELELSYDSFASLAKYGAEFAQAGSLALIANDDNPYATWLSGQRDLSHYVGPPSTYTWAMLQLVLSDSMAGTQAGYSPYQQWVKIGPDIRP